MLTAIALLISVGMAQLVLPAFNTLTNSNLTIPYGQPLFWGVLAGLLFFTGVLAGSRPAIFLSSFSTIKTLKAQRGSVLPRKILVVTQFTCSIALIVGTLIVYQQLQYARTRDTGYNVNRLLGTDLNPDLMKNYTALKNDLLNSGVVSSVTSASSPATGVEWHTALSSWPGRVAKEDILMGAIGISDDYFRTMGMTIVAGQGFTGKLGADTASIVFNEAAIEKMRMKNPLNQVVYFSDQPLRIVGVVRNALMNSPYEAAEPVMFLSAAKWAAPGTMLYRLSPSVGTHAAISKLETIFAKYNPAYPYGYEFADEAYGNKFKLEMLIGRLAGIFSALAIFISCPGPFWSGGVYGRATDKRDRGPQGAGRPRSFRSGNCCLPISCC